MYNYYKTARDAAWKFLIENEICSLPVNLAQVCQRNGYRLFIDNNDVYCSDVIRGVTYYKNQEYRLFINGKDPKPVQRYTVGHELGHIFMEHPLKDGKYGRTYGEQKIPKSPFEYAAERFAINILAPACVLWGLDLHSAEEIACFCDISIESATIRAERMQVLYNRGRFLESSLERSVFEQFRSFIDERRRPWKITTLPITL